VAQRVLTRHLLDRPGLKADDGHGGAVTLIQRFGSAANLKNLKMNLHCLVLETAVDLPGLDRPLIEDLVDQAKESRAGHSQSYRTRKTAPGR